MSGIQHWLRPQDPRGSILVLRSSGPPDLHAGCHGRLQRLGMKASLFRLLKGAQQHPPKYPVTLRHPTYLLTETLKPTIEVQWRGAGTGKGLKSGTHFGVGGLSTAKGQAITIPICYMFFYSPHSKSPTPYMDHRPFIMGPRPSKRSKALSQPRFKDLCRLSLLWNPSFKSPCSTTGFRFSAYGAWGFRAPTGPTGGPQTGPHGSGWGV